MPSQRISAGRLESAWRAEVARLASASAIEKIWKKQPELWKADEANGKAIRNRLGWVDVPEAMQRETDAFTKFAREIRDAGLRDTVLLGMGGSSLAPEVFSLTFLPLVPGRFHVLDSTDPASVLRIERALDLRATLFIAASKSGKTIETLSQLNYFRQKLEAAGVKHGKNFVAITDAGSQLEALAREQKFRRVFTNPTDIGGRYSALSYFGLVPAALWGVNVGVVLAGALEIRAACAPESPADANPGLALGALMGVAAKQGRDKMYLLATPTLVSLGYWIEQLVAESTGKEGKGVVPVAGESAGPAELFRDGGFVVALGLAGEDRGPIYDLIQSLARTGVPVVDIRLGRREQIGAEFFKWEVATAVAGATLGINPFDEPNVQESKDNTSRLLEVFQKEKKMPVGVPRLVSPGMELYVEGLARNRIFSSRLPDALKTFFNDRQPGDYLALLAYVDRSAANARRLEAMRLMLRDRLRMPVLLGYGPRLLHSIGQLYKGGPTQGMFLEITAADVEDVPVPGEAYTFGQLKLAQALGDMEALVRRDKPVLRLHLGEGTATGLANLQTLLQEALPAG